MNRETKKALTKQQLIASATALFRENGIHNTDLKSIAADAGVSVVTFYKYFDSKDTLVREIANDELNNLFDRIMAIADSPDLTILDKIKAFATLTATAQKKIATTYGPEMITLLETDDAHIRAVADTRRDTFFTTIIEQGRSEGFFNADVSTAAIRVYIDMFMSYDRQKTIALAQGEIDIKTIDQQLEQLFFYGLMGYINVDKRAQLDQIRQQNIE